MDAFLFDLLYAEFTAASFLFTSEIIVEERKYLPFEDGFRLLAISFAIEPPLMFGLDMVLYHRKEKYTWRDSNPSLSRS